MPTPSAEDLQAFIDYATALKGDEKGEAQLFCDRLFRAFGHGGIIEANGALEARIKFDSGRTKFADCLWSPRGRDGVLIEMKKRAVVNLESHFPQVRDYWLEMNPEHVIGEGAQKPKYVVLCNFDRFVIYRQLSKVDEVPLVDLVDRASALNFLLPEIREPIFHHNVEAISQDAARAIGDVFKHLVFDRSEDREVAQRFLLQCVLALFSEDFGLLPRDMFTELVRDCRRGESSYDLFGALFRQMAVNIPARGGRFKDVRYFNGGLFDVVEPIELDPESLDALARAADFNWTEVNPAIFGALFESTMNAKERHRYGAHFTTEEDIQKIVNPTIVRPWRARIAQAKRLRDLTDLLDELSQFRVLDPACGCGNFLYVAYRAVREVEMQIIEKIAADFAASSLRGVRFGITRVSTRQFMGFDLQPIAVEVAKMTLMLGRELAAEDWNRRIGPLMGTLPLSYDEGLPLDRLDDKVLCADALFCDWPEFDVVIGNPPFQSKNKMLAEYGREYVDRLRAEYPEVPGRADYCVYWFRRAHDEMKTGQRAGLVGTNTIRQNYSREGGLDYIVNNGGTITDAVSSQVWAGDAVVHVSIANWTKGAYAGEKRLTRQAGDSRNSPFHYYTMQTINSALSRAVDMSGARTLASNSESYTCFQGQTHGHEGFLVDLANIAEFAQDCPVFPYLTGDDMLSNVGGTPGRAVLDLNHVHNELEARGHGRAYRHLKATVWPAMKAKAEAEARETGRDRGPRQSHFKKWWRYWRSRDDMIARIGGLARYIACSRVTKRPIFAFVSSEIRPNDALQVFALDDDYSFGVLQSEMHWEWFIARCSTLKGDPRYTPNTVYDSFPWPQHPSSSDVHAIAKASRRLREARDVAMGDLGIGLRDLYRALEDAGSNPVAEAQIVLDVAVRKAYGMSKNTDVLEFLLQLNCEIAEKEQRGLKVGGPGVPEQVRDRHTLVTSDCVAMTR